MKFKDVVITINFFSAIACLIFSTIVIRAGLKMEGYLLIAGAVGNILLMYLINRFKK